MSYVISNHIGVPINITKAIIVSMTFETLQTIIKNLFFYFSTSYSSGIEWTCVKINVNATNGIEKIAAGT